MPMVRVAVIGHVEWLTHVRGDMPRPGEITHLEDPLEEPAGGGAVTAAQVARLGARCDFFTALADDATGDRSLAELRALGVDVHAARRPGFQTRAVSATAAGDRAIAVLGAPLVVRADDPLPWERLAEADAVYFTGHDPATLVAARAARVLVVTARRREVLAESRVRADVVVSSINDPAERVAPGDLPVEPGAILWTAGEQGGRYRLADGRGGTWSAKPVPGEEVDSYGCGDSFAGGLTVGLARGLDLDAAVRLGARCGAACLTARGGLAGQLVERG